MLIQYFNTRPGANDEPVFNFYMNSIFPYITPVIYPVSFQEKYNISFRGSPISLVKISISKNVEKRNSLKRLLTVERSSQRAKRYKKTKRE